MKKTITVSVDVDAWTEASKKVDNLSKYINDCLVGLVGKTLDERTQEQLLVEIEQYKEIVREANTKTSIAEQALEALKIAKIQRNKETLELEQYNRWICPVCKHQNYMDSLRCSKCNLPTKNESKTEIINVKGD